MPAPARASAQAKAQCLCAQMRPYGACNCSCYTDFIPAFATGKTPDNSCMEDKPTLALPKNSNCCRPKAGWVNQKLEK